MQPDNSKDSDEAKRLAKQQEMIDNVIRWLKDEGYEPEDVTDMHPDTAYFAKVKINERSGFHVGFSTEQLDSVVISEMIAMDKDYQNAYKSLPVLEQTNFFYDLKLALLQMNVMYNLESGFRELKSVTVVKPIYFDGLTKDKFFDTVFTVHHAIEIARTKLGLFRNRILPSQAGFGDDDDILK
ncbi:MAG: DUF2299 family protein [Thermoproteota archaeon]|nr:DUF2299 family protein [Thermoproteota archaeon]